MKKFAIAFVLLVTGAAAAWGVYHFVLARETALESVLPAGPHFYAASSGLGERMEILAATAFGQALARIDYRAALESSDAGEKTLDLFDAAHKLITSRPHQELAKRFLGREAAVAFYPPAGPLDAAGLARLPEQITVVLRPQDNARLIEFMSEFFTAFSEDVTEETVDYKDHVLHLFSSTRGEFRIGYVRIGDLLVFGLNDRAARAAVDTVTGGREPLSGDPGWGRVKTSFLPDAHTRVYVAMEPIVSGFSKQLGDLIAGRPEGVTVEEAGEQLARLRGLTAFGYSERGAGPVEGKMDVHFDPARLTDEMRHYYTCPPVENATLELIPRTALGYQWNNCYDLKYFWEQMKSGDVSAGPGSSPAAVAAGLKEKLGIDLETELLPVLGDEVGGFLTGVNTQSFIPIPEMVLFVEITDPVKAGVLVERVINLQPMFRPETEAYSGKQMHYLTIPLMTSLEPAYVITDRYLLVGTNRSVMRAALSAGSGPDASLAGGEALRASKLTLERPANSLFVARVGELCRQIEGLIDWGSQWMIGRMSQQEAYLNGSRKRLADVRQNADEARARTADLKARLEALPPEGEAAAGREALERSLVETEKELTSSEGAARDLEELIASYEAQKPRPERVQDMAERLVKPLVNAFKHMRYVINRTRIRENLIETLTVWEVE